MGLTLDQPSEGREATCAKPRGVEGLEPGACLLWLPACSRWVPKSWEGRASDIAPPRPPPSYGNRKQRREAARWGRVGGVSPRTCGWAWEGSEGLGFSRA